MIGVIVVVVVAIFVILLLYYCYIIVIVSLSLEDRSSHEEDIIYPIERDELSLREVRVMSGLIVSCHIFISWVLNTS